MTGLLLALLNNAIVATGLLGVGVIADRFVKWPAIRHRVWIAILLSLLVPAVFSIDVPVLRQGMAIEEYVPASTVNNEIAPTEPVILEHSAISDSSDAQLLPAVVTLLIVAEIAGAALILGMAFFRLRRLSLQIGSIPPSSPETMSRVRYLARNLKLTRLPRVGVTDELVTPMLVPVPTPTIVLSAPLLDSLSDAERDALISHELAHFRRGDIWVRWIEILATALYWWLPTVYFIRRRIRQSEEAACDALVLQSEGITKRTYAESLLKTVELTSAMAPASLVVSAGNTNDLKERILMIQSSSSRKVPRLAFLLSTAFILVACSVGSKVIPLEELDLVARETPEAQVATSDLASGPNEVSRGVQTYPAGDTDIQLQAEVPPTQIEEASATATLREHDIEGFRFHEAELAEMAEVAQATAAAVLGDLDLEELRLREAELAEMAEVAQATAAAVLGGLDLEELRFREAELAEMAETARAIATELSVQGNEEAAE